MPSSEPVHRAREIEDFTNLYFVHRFSDLLTPLFARLRIHPNTVSFTGLAFGIAAGFAYYHYQNIYWAICGFVLMVGWHVLDGVDGQLARLTNTQSEFGHWVDGICDYLTFIAVYIGLGLAIAAGGKTSIWPLILLAGALHAIQAAAYETQRQEFDFWGSNKQSAAIRDPDLHRLGDTDKTFVQRMVAALAAIYVTMQRAVGGINWELRDQLARTLKQRPECEEMIRRQYRVTFSSTVRCWSVLSPNYRTLGIFVFSALSIPLWYFLVEIVILTPAMFLLMRAQRGPNERFARFLSDLMT